MYPCYHWSSWFVSKTVFPVSMHHHSPSPPGWFTHPAMCRPHSHALEDWDMLGLLVAIPKRPNMVPGGWIMTQFLRIGLVQYGHPRMGSPKIGCENKSVVAFGVTIRFFFWFRRSTSNIPLYTIDIPIQSPIPCNAFQYYSHDVLIESLHTAYPWYPTVLGFDQPTWGKHIVGLALVKYHFFELNVWEFKSFTPWSMLEYHLLIR